MLALYRKYRPAVFGDVIAQDHVTRTLVNQIATGRITHAYLFTGSRGTGKTTCARIFARAVNCFSPENGSPCGKCEVCLALQKSNIDIVELDAASNNGVDQIREIVENVQYPPVAGKYKVYIIDEAHMLSASAFNALLKTLEEPPAHAIFILCTTEVHKLPATVLSRCMRFDFRLVPQPVLKERLREVYALEGVTADDEALMLIAAAAEGSWRDLLSLADRCMNYSLNLTAADVSEVLGTSGRESSRALMRAIAGSDLAGALTTVDRLCSEGKSVGLIAKDICAYARDLLLLKTSASAAVLASRDEVERMRAEAENYSTDLLVSVVSVFSAIDAELRYSVSPRIVLECAVMKAARLLSADLTALEERVARLERRLEGAPSVSPAAPVQATDRPADRPAARTEPPREQTEPVPPPAERRRPAQDKPMDARSVWGRILTHFRTAESSALFALLDRVTDVDIRGDKLVVTALPDTYLRLNAPDALEAFDRALSEDGAPYKLLIVKKSGGVDMDEEIAHLKKLIGDAKLNIKQ